MKNAGKLFHGRFTGTTGRCKPAKLSNIFKYIQVMKIPLNRAVLHVYPDSLFLTYFSLLYVLYLQFVIDIQLQHFQFE